VPGIAFAILLPVDVSGNSGSVSIILIGPLFSLLPTIDPG